MEPPSVLPVDRALCHGTALISDGFECGKTMVQRAAYRQVVATKTQRARRPKAGQPAHGAGPISTSKTPPLADRQTYPFYLQKFCEVPSAHRRDPPPGGGAPLPRSLRSSKKIVKSITFMLPISRSQKREVTFI